MRAQLALIYVVLSPAPRSADPPDAPGKPEIEDYDNVSVSLKWEAPKSDNGAPIQRYIIEKKNKKFGEWEKAAEVGCEENVNRTFVNNDIALVIEITGACI